MKTPYLQIAVLRPLRKTLDYRLPCKWNHPIPQPGSRIRVPLGNQSVIGILIATHQKTPDFAVKEIEAVIDERPLLDKHLMELLAWAGNYYLHPIGDVFANALPSRLRRGRAATRQQADCWKINTPGNPGQLLIRAPKQRAIYDFISQHAPCSADKLNQAFDSWRPELRTLLNKSLIMASSKPVQHNVSCMRQTLSLNSAQASVLSSLISASRHYDCHLLFGITGSGKTEIYLQLTDHLLKQGKQVLILVPEIGLTPQLHQQFSQRFQVPAFIMHSSLSDGERQNTWLAAATGKAQIIIGTRSAVFIPLAKPGLIIVDEEHDASFKQMDGFRYCARDIAVKRAYMLDIPILLGSATPSLESLYNVARQRFRLLTLNERATQASCPDIYHVDMRNQRLLGGFAPRTLDAIDAEITQGGQVLIFLNRRGYAPALVCNQCGWTAKCSRCDIRMTWHKQRQRLSCHICSHEISIPATCPDCCHDHFYPLGQGTERLEELLKQRYPDMGVTRIDRDSTRRKNAFETIIREVHAGQHRILIGTQMLAKGHHFPQVGTVIILDADSGLYGLDFRSQERMAQLITQVAGRAGRETRHGRVFIQTWHPRHAFFTSLQSQHYNDFAKMLSKERAITGMPPYGFLALLRAEANRIYRVEAFMNQVTSICQKFNHANEVLGPAMAPLERKAGHYRMQLLFKANTRKSRHELLQPVVSRLDKLKQAKHVRWSIDIDPYDLY